MGPREGASVLLSEWYNSHIVFYPSPCPMVTCPVFFLGKNINVVHLSYTDVSVSLPTTVSVAEGAGMVEVCATLSGPDIMRTDIPISISLETADGRIIVRVIVFKKRYLVQNLWRLAT